MSRPRLVVFGYSDVGHACLKFLLDRGENVAAVYTHEDNPGEQLWFPSVAGLARERNVVVRTPESFKSEELVAEFRRFSPDLVFSFYYRNMIPKEVFGFPRLGAFNMHGSYLPKFRGRAPVNWAVLKGEKQTGATLHVMVEKPDAGDMVDQEAVPIGPDDTTAVVQARVTAAAVKVLARQIDNLKAGRAILLPQNHAEATYFGRRRPEDGAIDWSRPAREIHNLVRAVTHPYPGAYADIFGVKTYIWETHVIDTSHSKEKPGSFFYEDGKLGVECGDGGALEIRRLQREGEKEVSGVEFGEKFILRRCGQ